MQELLKYRNKNAQMENLINTICNILDENNIICYDSNILHYLKTMTTEEIIKNLK